MRWGPALARPSDNQPELQLAVSAQRRSVHFRSEKRTSYAQATSCQCTCCILKVRVAFAAALSLSVVWWGNPILGSSTGAYQPTPGLMWMCPNLMIIIWVALTHQSAMASSLACCGQFETSLCACQDGASPGLKLSQPEKGF